MTWFHREPHYFACFTRPFGEGKGEKHREGHVESQVSTEEDLVDLNKKLVHCGSPSLLLGPCPLVVLPAPQCLVQGCSLLIPLPQGNQYIIKGERGIYISLLQLLCVA